MRQNRLLGAQINLDYAWRLIRLPVDLVFVIHLTFCFESPTISLRFWLLLRRCYGIGTGARTLAPSRNNTSSPTLNDALLPTQFERYEYLATGATAGGLPPLLSSSPAQTSVWLLLLTRVRLSRMLCAVVLIEGGLDRERRLAVFIRARCDPTARRASPSRKRIVLKPDKLSSHGRVFSHRFEQADCDPNHTSLQSKPWHARNLPVGDVRPHKALSMGLADIRIQRPKFAPKGIGSRSDSARRTKSQRTDTDQRGAFGSGMRSSDGSADQGTAATE
jgi:hypothetical protein